MGDNMLNEFYFSICCCIFSKNILCVIAIGNVWQIQNEFQYGSHRNISFQRREPCLHLDKFHRSHQHWTAKTATGWPEIPQTLTSWNACNTSYCMEYKCMQFSVASYIWCTCMQLLHSYSYEGMLSKSIPFEACAWCNRVVAYVIAICKNIAFVLFTRTSMIGLCWASCVVEGHFSKQKGFR